MGYSVGEGAAGLLQEQLGLAAADALPGRIGREAGLAIADHDRITGILFQMVNRGGLWGACAQKHSYQ